ncbi:hypothetical protein TrRE_jg7073, partial [Triparma retinervis]
MEDSAVGIVGGGGGWDGSNTLGPIREVWEKRTSGRLITLVNLMFPKLSVSEASSASSLSPLPRLPSGYDVKRLVSEFKAVLSAADPRGERGGGKGMAEECCGIVGEAAEAMADNARGGYGRGGQEWMVMVIMDEVEKGLNEMGEKVFIEGYGTAVGKDDYRTAEMVKGWLGKGAQKVKEVGDYMEGEAMKRAKKECAGEGWSEKVEVWRGKLKGGRAGRFMVDLVTFCVLSEITLTFLTRKEPLAFLNPIT